MTAKHNGFFQHTGEAAPGPTEQPTQGDDDFLESDGDELDVGGDSLEVGNDFLEVGDDWVEVD